MNKNMIAKELLKIAKKLSAESSSGEYAGMMKKISQMDDKNDDALSAAYYLQSYSELKTNSDLKKNNWTL